MRKQPWLLLLFVILALTTNAQQYTVNGNSSQINCHCYTLTPNSGNKSGSVWNNFKIDLTQSFDFNFTINLGSTDANGADGIAFVLQPISTSVGSTGNGMGFGGISPAIGITLDTYQNSSPDADPAYDHIAIQRNGDLVHTSSNNLAGPIPILATSNNVEDGQDHNLRIKWDAATKTITTYVDNVLRLSAVNDLVATTFGGNPMVYWGFTGATGGLFNLQKFCTALSPQVKSLAPQKRCIGEPVSFVDSTISFTTVQKMYWDFGDGSDIDSVNKNPVHIYTAANDYVVKQRVRGADGCEETNTFNLRIGSKPVAGFSLLDSCIVNSNVFKDTSKVSVGTINQWYWGLGDGITATVQSPAVTYTSYGLKNIKLAVRSLEGCSSDTLYKTIRIRAVPVADFTFTDSVCLGSPTTFHNATTTPDGLPFGHLWHFENIVSAALDTSFTFSQPGAQQVLLVAGIGQSCTSSKTKEVFVVDKPRAGIKKAVICQSAPYQLKDSSYATDGIAITGWWWDLGNGQFSTSKDPLVTYNTTTPVTIRHVAKNARGCLSDTLTLTLNIAAKPVADFGVGEALCNNNQVQFSDSSKITSGNITQWHWVNSDTVFSTLKNGVGLFPAGPHKAGLVVVSNAGCVSDTAYKTFTIKTKPSVSMNFSDACKFAVVNFSAAEITNIGISNWKWIFGDGASGAGINTTHSYSANNDYKVKLIATSSEGCFSDTLARVIHIYGTNAFAGNDIIAAAGEPVQLHAIGGLSYSWTPGAGFLNNDAIADPIATLNATQTFRLKAFTPEGCESYDEVTVEIYKGPDFYLPNAFTPNRDGLNDIFRGTPVGIKKLNYMRIFNRWGEQLFYTTDMNKGWDGRYKGIDQATGTYIVLISCIDFRGKLIERKFPLQLLR